MMKQSTLLRSTFLAIVLMFGYSFILQARIIYVKGDASGISNGLTWTDAIPDLQSAIDQSEPGDTLCVATGIYYPTRRIHGDSIQNATFYIDKDIIVLGGFSGEPGTEGDLSLQDMVAFPTTLSGNLGDMSDTLDNAFHVIYLDHVSDTMRLEGFFICEGYNFNATGLDASGAGIFNDAEGGRSNPVIADCYINTNHSKESGGAMMNYASFGGTANPTLIHCKIIENHGSGGGGITYLTDDGGQCNSTLISCYFQGNAARTSQGGAISVIAHSATTQIQMINCIVTGNLSPGNSAFDAFVTGTGLAQPEFINCVFSGNSHGSIRVADIGLRQSTVTIRNSILWANGSGHGLTTNGATEDVTHSIIQFGFEGEGNLPDDPKFIDPPAGFPAPHGLGNVHLQSDSPAIDAGENSALPSAILTDADDLPRFIDVSTGETDGIVDIGPFEIQEKTTGTRFVSGSLEVSVFPNPASTELNLMLPESDDVLVCSIWSQAGESIFQKQLATGTRSLHIDVQSWLPGVYYLLVSTKERAAISKVILAHSF